MSVFELGFGGWREFRIVYGSFESSWRGRFRKSGLEVGWFRVRFLNYKGIRGRGEGE